MKAALAARDFARPLIEELGETYRDQHDRLILFDGTARPVWAQNLWLECERFEFDSISQAAKKLRSVQRNWWLHSTSAHRRAQLIREKLPPLKDKLWPYPSVPPPANLGSWTLLDERTLFFSAKCSSPYPDGELFFIENKVEPPSRAYLKLWEIFTLTQRQPSAGARVLDLGSSPGGWTWVLDQLGCEVLSVDKAPLSATTKFSPRVTFLEESAFGLAPRPVDWLFCDVICYPDRLLEMVRRWQGFARNFVCTLKFQGPTQQDVVREFLALGGETRHLTCNKHELTWTNFMANTD